MSQHQIHVMEQSLLQMQNALVVAMEEVESVRKEMLLENAKLQREFRETIDAVVQHSEDTVKQSVVGGKPGGAGRGGAAASISAGMDDSALKDQNSRIEFLEIALRSMQDTQHTQTQQLMNLVASATTTAQVNEAKNHSENLVSDVQTRVNQDMDRREERFIALEKRVKDLMHQVQQQSERKQAEMEKSIRESEDKTVQQVQKFMSETKQSTAELSRECRNLGVTVADVKATVKSQSDGLGALTSRPHGMSRAEAQTLVASSVQDSATALREENDRMRESVNALQQLALTNERKISVLEENFTQLDTDLGATKNDLNAVRTQSNKTTRQAETLERSFTEVIHASPGRGAGPGESRASAKEVGQILEKGAEMLQQMEVFVQDFTNNQATVVKDDVLRVLESEPVVMQRRMDDKRLKEEHDVLKQDVLRCLTQAERVTDDVSRLTQQQHSLYQAFQRSEQQFSSLSYKVDTQLKDEFQRIEQSNKSFFSRQEAMIQDERHQLSVKLTNEFNKMQVKHNEEFHRNEQRRQNDNTSYQDAMREDFQRFSQVQQERLDNSLGNMKTELQRYVTSTTDDALRTYNNQQDAYRRQQQAQAEETRKTTTQTLDDLKRLKQQSDENTSRLAEQANFLNNRVQKSVDDELRRIDRLQAESQLRIEKQVDEAVHRVVGTTEGSFQRNLVQTDEKFTKEVSLIKEELSATRNTMEAIAAPSGSVQAIDSRVNVLRKDMSTMMEAAERIKDVERKINANLRSEVKQSADAQRTELLRDVALQLQRFDQAVGEIRREQNRANESLELLQHAVDKNQSSIQSIVRSDPTQMLHTSSFSGFAGQGTPGFSAVRNVPADASVTRQRPFKAPATPGTSGVQDNNMMLHSPAYENSASVTPHRAAGGGVGAAAASPNEDLLIGAFASTASP